MRKLHQILIGSIFSALLIFSVVSVASAQSSDEAIRNFDVTAKINQDSSVNITEHIVYDFGSGEKHGIYRDIPVKYSTSLGNQSIRLSAIHVVDQNGAPIKFTVSSKGKDKEIKIGDANILVGGIRTYDISYTVDRAIGYFADHDELYWNATGNEWEVPIDEASFEISLPSWLDQSKVSASCYYGSFGSTDQCTAEIPALTSATTTTLGFFRAPRPLDAGEGLTGALGFPKGLVHQPTQTENIIQFIKDNWVVVLPIAVFFWMLSLWWRKGRDPKGRGTIIAEYDAPKDLAPLEMSAIMHEGMHKKDISAEIIECAVKGYLTITRTEEKHFLSKSTDYTFEKKKDPGPTAHPLDKLLVDDLFGEDADIGTKVAMSDLKTTFYKSVIEIDKQTTSSVVTKGYFPSSPKSVRQRYIVIAFLSFFLIVWSSGSFPTIYPISLGISAAFVLIFGLLMPHLTEEGVRIKESTLGLKEYLQIAEKDRINFHDAPEKTPKLFEKLLPFAMVLGVEKAWAKEFNDIYTSQPAWYNDSYGGTFNTVLFVNNMSSFSSAAVSTLATAPGGSSGSGGGGFSGGGGGGGGGGSW